MKRSMALTALLIVLSAATVPAAEPPAPAESAQALYLQAGKAERQGQQARARELYETIIDRFPSSELAVKSNDRLLELLDPRAEHSATKPTPAATGPKEKVRELLELKNKAAGIYDKERRRLSIAFFNRYEHRYSRSELREQEVEWDKAAEAKVKKELGMGTAEIKQKLEATCREAGVSGRCDEDALK